MMTIASTIKGYGVSFMQNSVNWHYKSPSTEDLSKALSELENFSK
jgi:transketolase